MHNKQCLSAGGKVNNNDCMRDKFSGAEGETVTLSAGVNADNATIVTMNVAGLLSVCLCVRVNVVG